MFNIDIKKIRMESNKNQEETAKLLHISRSSYAMWESGNEIIPIKRLIDFSNIFNVSIDYIFKLNSKKYNKLSTYNKELSSTRLKEFRKENKLTQEKLAITFLLIIF